MKVNITELKEIIRVCIEKNEIITIKGSPGIGKTDIIKQMVAVTGRKLFVQHPAVDDLTDYKGFPVLDSENLKVDFKPIGMMRELIECKEPCVWYLDDIGQAPMANQGGIMQWIGRGSRGLNEYQLPKECAVIMATNDITHNAGVQGFIDPFKNRPLTILELVPSVNEWLAYANLQRFDPYVIAYVQRQPQHLNVPDRTKALVGYPTPRSWENVSDIRHMNIEKELKETMILGTLGEGVGASFNAFVQAASNIPSVEEIIEDPYNADLPATTSEYYAAAMALAHQADEKNIHPILIYIDRFEYDEYKSVFAVSMNLMEDGAINTSEYRDWKIVNEDLFIEVDDES